MFNQSRLIRYEAFMIDGQNYCTNKRECTNHITNTTFECPLWRAYCGPLYQSEANASSTKNDLNDLEMLDNPVKQSFIHLCHYFQHDDSVQLRLGIPGVSNIRPISGKSIHQLLYSYLQATIFNIFAFKRILSPTIEVKAKCTPESRVFPKLKCLAKS